MFEVPDALKKMMPNLGHNKPLGVPSEVHNEVPTPIPETPPSTETKSGGDSSNKYDIIFNTLDLIWLFVSANIAIMIVKALLKKYKSTILSTNVRISLLRVFALYFAIIIALMIVFLLVSLAAMGKLLKKKAGKDINKAVIMSSVLYRTLICFVMSYMVFLYIYIKNYDVISKIMVENVKSVNIKSQTTSEAAYKKQQIDNTMIMIHNADLLTVTATIIRATYAIVHTYGYFDMLNAFFLFKF